MSTKEQALYNLLHDEGYSYGAVVTAMQILSQSREAMDDVIAYVYDEHPSEMELIEHIAQICS